MYGRCHSPQIKEHNLVTENAGNAANAAPIWNLGMVVIFPCSCLDGSTGGEIGSAAELYGRYAANHGGEVHLCF